jgi:hypothetical protein
MPPQISDKAMNGWGKRKQNVAVALAMDRKENRGNQSGLLFLLEEDSLLRNDTALRSAKTKAMDKKGVIFG